MRGLSFILLALVGTMILEIPIQSYADPQLDILLNIATQARDNLSAAISQTNNVSDEIKQLKLLLPVSLDFSFDSDLTAASLKETSDLEVINM